MDSITSYFTSFSSSNSSNNSKPKKSNSKESISAGDTSTWTAYFPAQTDLEGYYNSTDLEGYYNSMATSCSQAAQYISSSVGLTSTPTEVVVSDKEQQDKQRPSQSHSRTANDGHHRSTKSRRDGNGSSRHRGGEGDGNGSSRHRGGEGDGWVRVPKEVKYGNSATASNHRSQSQSMRNPSRSQHSVSSRDGSFTKRQPTARGVRVERSNVGHAESTLNSKWQAPPKGWTS